ncbi:MAG TPA: ABC transporter ATP-binding protein [Candidatus Saccharimonadales bacterium]|nr:ABC transporter ATP-binding protein [Candidatus Saccharimonadales bacterium]
MATSVKINKLNVTLGGQVKALKNISLEIAEGKITGIIGPSGAGKTTLIKCIVGRLEVSAGTVEILGFRAGASQLRHQLSYMTQEQSVYSDLTVKENLLYFACMVGQTKKQAGKTIEKLLATIEMSDKQNALISNLSGGQKQRVSLAIALIASPKLMVLDEPTIGLDPALRERLWKIFNEIARQGTTLIISSHSMDEARRCEDLVLLREGEIIAHSSPQQLLKNTNTSNVEDAFLKLVSGQP